MGQWVEVSAVEVRLLPDGTRARLYSMDVHGFPQCLDGFIWHKGKYSAELRPATSGPVPVRDYRNKIWKILKED